ANRETFKLESIVVDVTDSEAAVAGALLPFKEGLPHVLTPSSSVQHGQRSHQTSVYPLTFKPTSEKPNPPLLETLVLEKIMYMHRALILHFNSIFLMGLDKKTRGFKIGMALVFQKYVLVFPSIDLLFQVVLSFLCS
ncbi:hypothetical protein B0H10DRAFT_2115017, partial [Mycena sp. CBHHK59/15]